MLTGYAFGWGVPRKRFLVTINSRAQLFCLPRRMFSSKPEIHSVGGSQKLGARPDSEVPLDDLTMSPSALLRAQQREKESMVKNMSDEMVPPPPPRRSGKTIIMETKNISESGLGKSKEESNDLGKGNQRPVTNNRFLQKLTEMENSTGTSSSGLNSASKARKQAREEKVLKERERMLIFRDVGMDLDKPILSRDVFLVFKYFRYGIEFAVDNELERMLRYFNEHALNELKIIQNSKLMRGPATLSRKRNLANHESMPFQLTPSFPLLQAANMRQYCRYTKELEQKLDILFKPNSLCNFYRKEKKGDNLNSLKTFHSFCENDSTQMTSFSPSTFRRPAVIIYSQLGQKLGAQADLEWRRLAYATIYPSLLQYLPDADIKGEGHILSTSEHQKGGLRLHSKEDSHGISKSIMPIDVVSFRSMDVYKYRWVHKLYVRRFAQSLIPSVQSSESQTSDTQVNGLLTASSTFVGCKLLQPFYSVLGLRNYLSPHIMLVDHEGMIRWLSAGCPDEYEREHFPALLRQLEHEYNKARAR
ncbi:uncharacterized protein TM35_000201750 [Trypanosoma theileri]|uniref:Uncharacterized protein n=1 Tax=Trypanosoma theileri TaxID=67003 RepID=A0A1X0NST3_9TRYP|nr:uncharacterized protein TM35_000201750 [Trypanosoma theileri]ORC87766.1 hypothetical protein TM35_000201750 [Trypanosoma theileri]